MPLEFNKTSLIKNAFDLDFYFMKNANNLNYSNNKQILDNFKNVDIMNGIIFHSKQLKNLYPNIEIYHFNNNIFVFYKWSIYFLQDFVKRFVYSLSYKRLCELIIKKKYYNINNDIKLLVIVFIGNETRGLDLINKLIYYKSVQEYNVAYCFNSHNLLVSEKIKSLIKSNFTNYAIYMSKELGTDITSTLMMYESILSNDYKPEHIIKLPTKSITSQYIELTDY